MEDNEIIDLLWERNEQAIEEVSLKYGSYCHKIANNILNNCVDSEECVNDTWLKTWNSIPTHRPNNFFAFLAKITRNLALNKWNYGNAKKRCESNAIVALNELEECVAGKSNTEKEYESNILVQDINNFLRSISEREQSIFVLRYFYSESISDIAEKHEISENNASAILSRTRKKLHKYLIKEGYII